MSRKTFAESVLNKYYGVNGISNPLSDKTTDSGVRKHRPERLMSANNIIVQDKYAAFAEAAMLEKQIINMQKRGFSEAEITKTIKNGATDLWRKVKELIKALRIVIEESVAKLVSKKKPVEKVMAELTFYENKIRRRQTSLAAGEDNYDDGDMEDVVIKVPTRLGNTVGQTRLGNRNTRSNTQINYTNTTTLDGLLSELESHSIDVAGVAVAAFWFTQLASKTTSRGMKNTYREMKRGAREFNRGRSATGRPGLQVPTTGRGANPTAGPINTVLNLGEELERQEAILNNAKRRLNLNKSYAEETTINGNSPVVNKLSDLIPYFVFAAQEAREVIKGLETIETQAKIIKTALNKIENAPTSATGNIKPDVLQTIRTVCQRANKAVNINRKEANVAASTFLLDANALLKVGKEVVGRLPNENDDEIIRGR